jgi:hypothetical protein
MKHSRFSLRSLKASAAIKEQREAALLGHEYEDENDDDGHGCGAAVRDR